MLLTSVISAGGSAMAEAVSNNTPVVAWVGAGAEVVTMVVVTAVGVGSAVPAASPQAEAKRTSITAKARAFMVHPPDSLVKANWTPTIHPPPRGQQASPVVGSALMMHLPACDLFCAGVK